MAPDQTDSWLPLIVLMTATFVYVVDFFVVNVALPAISSGLRASSGAIEWVVAGYSVMSAALLVTGARIGDCIGPRRAFAVGLGAFTVASAICALSPTPVVLIAGRLAQGVGTALMAPSVLALLGRIYAGTRRVRAVSIYGIVMGFAAVSGQLIGGALIGAGLSWRSIFWVNVPIGIVGVLLARRIPKIAAERGGRFDIVGTLLLTAGLVATVLPLVEGRAHGWPWWSWLCLSLAPVLLGGFAVAEWKLAARGGEPLLDPAILRQAGLGTGLLVQVVFWCQQAASYLFLALFLQSGRGLSPIQSGAVFAVLAVGYLMASSKAPALVARFGRELVLAGLLLAVVGDAALALTAALHGPVVLLFPGLLVLGAGQGLCITPLMSTVLGYATPQSTGAISGALAALQQVGNAIGVGVVGVVFFGAVRDGYGVAFERAFLVLAALLVVAALLTRLLPRRAGPGSGSHSPRGDVLDSRSSAEPRVGPSSGAGPRR